jgi:hypothetical protein
MNLHCAGCNKTPDEIDYSWIKEEDETNDQYVIREEGTLDTTTGAFLCDPCYDKAGQPSQRHTANGERWTATEENLARIGFMP